MTLLFDTNDEKRGFLIQKEEIELIKKKEDKFRKRSLEYKRVRGCPSIGITRKNSLLPRLCDIEILYFHLNI